MSAEAVGWVYKFSPYSGASFSVHLAIADSANDQHQMELWMALGKLGRKSRVSRTTTSEIVATMVADGFLELIEQSLGGRHKPSRYRFLMPAGTKQFFGYQWREGTPTETVLSGDSSPTETVASDRETVLSADETVPRGDTRRTQGNPMNLPVLRVCCGEEFRSLELYQDHLETCIEANDWTPAAELEAAVSPVRPPCSGLTDIFFPDEGGSYALARIICASCPYKQACFELGRHEFHGMWGGTSPRERRAMAA